MLLFRSFQMIHLNPIDMESGHFGQNRHLRLNKHFKIKKSIDLGFKAIPIFLDGQKKIKIYYSCLHCEPFDQQKVKI